MRVKATCRIFKLIFNKIKVFFRKILQKSMAFNTFKRQLSKNIYIIKKQGGLNHFCSITTKGMRLVEKKSETINMFKLYEYVLEYLAQSFFYII